MDTQPVAANTIADLWLYPYLHAPLAALFRSVQLKPGSTLYGETDIGDAAYVIVQGSMSVVVKDESGGDVQLAVLSRGSCVGERCLVEPGPRRCQVRCGSSYVCAVTPPVRRADCACWRLCVAGRGVDSLCAMAIDPRIAVPCPRAPTDCVPHHLQRCAAPMRCQPCDTAPVRVHHQGLASRCRSPGRAGGLVHMPHAVNKPARSGGTKSRVTNSCSAVYVGA